MTVRQTVVSVCVLVVIISLPHVSDSFQPLFSLVGNTITHRDITKMAVLQKTAEVCRDIAASEGRDFSLNINKSLSAEMVQRACSSTDASISVFSSIKFRMSIINMYFSNALVDVVHFLSDMHHFDSETFKEGREVITAGVSAVKASVKLESFVAGRWTLGRVCHTLQDFYSHSNWVELGNGAPYGALITPDQPLMNLAEPSTPTCRSCAEKNCTSNLLPELMQRRVLTSGYFNILSSAKPSGKCSHGGWFDRTSKADPVGGINKDDVRASHGFLHHKAADLAVKATMELLEDIRVAAGDKNFLRLMGLSQSSVLCFVIDTTGSMSDDITEAKRVSFEIIDRKRGTQQEPSAYILVPFNDPGFGPLIMTTNADVFKDKISRLSANGGGDIPELSLSGLQTSTSTRSSSGTSSLFHASLEIQSPQGVPVQSGDLLQAGHAENTSRRRSRGQMTKPPQQAPPNVEVQWFNSESLPDVRAPHPIFKAEPSLPFGRLYSENRFLVLPKAHDHRWITLEAPSVHCLRMSPFLPPSLTTLSTNNTKTQLALTAAPPSSEIFVFTDAPAKDAHLKNTITALIESTKSAVTFMLTDVLSRRRSHRCSPAVNPRSMGQSDAQLYRDLAQASGGQVIEVTKSDLSLATSVIEDSSASAVVTVFQTVKNPGRPGYFYFTADGLLRNITIYITGAPSITFSLTSSTGSSQRSTQSSRPLASYTTVGNLHRLSLNTDNPTGLWQVRVRSHSPYSIKVKGQSSVDFIYNLVEAHEGVHGDFSLKQGRPLSGGNATILVSVTGSDAIKVNEVTLFDGSGPTEINGSLQSVGSGDFLVTFTGVPAGDFVLILKGEDVSSTSRSTSSSFQRQASTRIKTSSISVTAQANITDIEPGSIISIPFTVAMTTNGVVNDNAAGSFTVRANNDRSYASTSPDTVTVESGAGGKANSTVTLTVPASAASGTDVTLTIEAQDAAGTDINYTVLRFSVAAKVTDVTRPACQVVNTSANCSSSSSLCASSQWEFIANLTDGINGTGIERLTNRHGNGSLNSSLVVGAGGENITVVAYRGSCCSPNVELAAVDRAGNVGRCVIQARPAPTTTAAGNTASSRGRTLSITHAVWISVVASALW